MLDKKLYEERRRADAGHAHNTYMLGRVDFKGEIALRLTSFGLHFGPSCSLCSRDLLRATADMDRLLEVVPTVVGLFTFAHRARCAACNSCPSRR